jgi:hypothetical protein
VPELTRAFLAFIFGICLIVAAAAISPSNNVIIVLPHKHTTLKTLTLGANSFTVGNAPGTVIGNVLNTTPGSTVTFNSLSVANSLQLANTSGVWQVQVGSSAPSGATLITFNLVETLAGAPPKTTSGLAVNENAVAAFDPSNPGAAGYALVFDDEFSSPNTIDSNNTLATGFNWYVQSFGIQGQTALPAGDYSVSGGVLNFVTSNNFNAGLQTAAPASNSDGFVGRAFGGGAYYEARVKVNMGNIDPSQSWPSFWSNSLEISVNNSLHNAQWPGQPSGYVDFVENDFMELDLCNQNPNCGLYNGAVHNWYGQKGVTCGGTFYCDLNNNFGGGSNFQNGNGPSVPGGTDWTQFHTFGVLWVAGNVANGGNGYIQYYFDNVPNTDKVTWVDGIGTPPPSGFSIWSVLDTQHMYVVLGTSASTTNYGYTINWVHVWQIPGQGTCVGSGCN